jgi:tricarballylate dehydrogenase
MSEPTSFDVIVVGAGNAAISAAVAAQEQGKTVCLLEKASRELRGGNTRFTGGVFRFAYDGAKDIANIAADANNIEARGASVGYYTKAAFYDDLMKVTDGRADPTLTELLVRESLPTMQWMAGLGVGFHMAGVTYAVGHVQTGGRATEAPTGTLTRATGEGPQLSETLFRIAAEREIPVFYDTMMLDLVFTELGRVSGVTVRDGSDQTRTLRAGNVILACGGFESSPEMRSRYLGPLWDNCKVRGTRFDTGDGLNVALRAGARAFGQWSGCHATPIDVNAPESGSIEIWDKTNRLSYPYSVMVDREGYRFVDEGEDFAGYTYAKYGRAILERPGSVAYQIFDAKCEGLLEPRYSTGAPVVARTIEDLAVALGIDPEVLSHTIAEFNDSVNDVEFSRSILDGKRTDGLVPKKSNWAQRIDAPPYTCYPVTCGITFTFGGIQINEQSQVLDGRGRVMPGLYAAGEMTGGFFYQNYPVGSGLMRGSVTGRIAGAHAALEGPRA